MPASNMATLEVCCADLTSAQAAAEGGAQRIELCRDLHLDGLTPTKDIMLQARQIAGLKLHILIRAREGDFVYNESEAQLMLQQIDEARSCGADGVVIGALTPEGDIDTNLCQRFVDAAAGMQITFHRAFDQCQNPLQALEQIIALGCHRLLTSGQASTAEAGIPLLRQLVRQASGRIIIMPGAGVNPGNADHILTETGATEIHSSARHSAADLHTDADVVRQLVQIVANK